MFGGEKDEMSTSEIVELTGKKQTNVLRELEKLAGFGIVKKTKKDGVNFYFLNKDYSHYETLKKLFNDIKKSKKEYLLINEESGVAFLSLHYFMRGFFDFSAVKQEILSDIPEIISHFKNDYGRFYVVKSVWERIADESLKKLLKDTAFVKNIIFKISMEKGEEAKKIFNDLRRKQFEVKKEEACELLEKFQDIIGTQISHNYIAVLDIVDYKYSNYIKKYLSKILKDSNYSVNYVMEKLLAPDNLSFTQLMRADLIKNVLSFKKSNNRVEIDKIHKEWEWLNHGYRGPGLTFEYFEENFNELLEKEINVLESELDKILNYEELVKKEKEILFNELNIDKKHIDFISAMSLLSYLKVYRKDISFMIIFSTLKMLDNFNNINLKRDNLLYLTLDEAKNLIMGELEISVEKLLERENESLYISKDNVLLTGDEAASFVEDNFKNISSDDESVRGRGELKLLNGMTACLGGTGNWIHGKVKIINKASDMVKMDDGDILVSTATTPELLPAMKKASAIVTDHGGITCHAAIVSRELNKPCLIGTKYATKLFKDGDKVVVCPRHGYIKFQ